MTDYITYMTPEKKVYGAVYRPRKTTGILLSFMPAALKTAVAIKKNELDTIGINPHHVDVTILTGDLYYDRAVTIKRTLPFNHDDFERLVIGARQGGSILDVCDKSLATLKAPAAGVVAAGQGMTDYITFTAPATQNGKERFLPRKVTGIILSFRSAAVRVLPGNFPLLIGKTRPDVYDSDPRHVEVLVATGTGIFGRREMRTINCFSPFNRDDFERLVLAKRREGGNLDISSDEKIEQLQNHPAIRPALSAYRG